jgi:hypothetical protein
LRYRGAIIVDRVYVVSIGHRNGVAVNRNHDVHDALIVSRRGWRQVVTPIRKATTRRSNIVDQVKRQSLSMDQDSSERSYRRKSTARCANAKVFKLPADRSQATSDRSAKNNAEGAAQVYARRRPYATQRTRGGAIIRELGKAGDNNRTLDCESAGETAKRKLICLIPWADSAAESAHVLMK